MGSGHEQLENHTNYTEPSFQIVHNRVSAGLWSLQEGKQVSPIISPDQGGLAIKSPAVPVSWRMCSRQWSLGRLRCLDFTWQTMGEEGAPWKALWRSVQISGCEFMKQLPIRLEKELQESRRPSTFWNSCRAMNFVFPPSRVKRLHHTWGIGRAHRRVVP